MPRKLPAGRPERTAFTISELNLHWIGILPVSCKHLTLARVLRVTCSYRSCCYQRALVSTEVRSNELEDEQRSGRM